MRTEVSQSPAPVHSAGRHGEFRLQEGQQLLELRHGQAAVLVDQGGADVGIHGMALPAGLRRVAAQHDAGQLLVLA